MRLCRYQLNGTLDVALYLDQRIASLKSLATQFKISLPDSASVQLLDYLPPEGRNAATAREINKKFESLPAGERERLTRPVQEVKLKTPIADPKKVILLAGNYASHIEEGGRERALEREQTFPYFFWKPPTTTLTDPGDPVRIPPVSPKEIDWELELGIVMGRTCRNVSEADALKYVAGYTVCNDISDRNFQINPGRKKRDKDSYFDWLHGKWHDTFLPCGPCILSADAAPDPQKFPMKLRVNDKVMQDANTSHMIFGSAAIVSILSSFMTLEPGDIISTGTPGGVGKARKPPVFLKHGDVMEAEISGIGILRNPVV